MKRSNIVPYLVCGISAAALVSSLGAAEISATVRAVSGEVATLTMDGDLFPAVGDKTEIFFKLAGGDDDVSVATGRIAKVENDAVEVKIEEATGTVEKNQLARIRSEKPQTKKKTEGEYSLAGRWNVKGLDGKLAATLVFHPDGTAAFNVPQGQGLAFNGQYIFEQKATPPRFEITRLRITPPPGFSKEDLKAFWAALEQGLAAQGSSLQELEAAVAVGEFDSPTQFRFTQFKSRAEVPQGALGPGAVVFAK